MPEPLRNGCNAERPIQIRLELDRAEWGQLQLGLTHLLHTGGVGADLHRDLQSVLTKLNDAAERAVHRIQCPVCREWFSQGALGRSAQYCAPACKQKAYRQRHNARKRQIPLPTPRH